MKEGDIAERGLVLLGCGKMGLAMLEGWLARGLPVGAVWVIDPAPSERVQALAAQGLHLNTALPADPAVAILAVKPQMMGAALPALAGLGCGRTLFISVAAGVTLATLEAALGAGAALVRAMPNTPAAIGQGITAVLANAVAGPAGLGRAQDLLSAVGQVVALEHEGQMDAVTAVSGSGPAYVFYLIEALAAAGVAEGLPPDLSMRLARATVAGAGQLARDERSDPAALRAAVTSPGGTTAAALAHLMEESTGLGPLMARAVAAAAARSRELGA